MLVAPGLAQAVMVEDASTRILTDEAARLVGSSDPTVRGEAALVLAAARDPRQYDAVLAVAKDKAPEAQLRGILALGVMATPGAERVLEDLLLQSATRARPEGIAAAYALGCMPRDTAPAELGRYLARFRQSNYKRQRDLLGAMLVAMQGGSHPAQIQALRLILDDEANRDDSLKGQLVATLAALDHGLEDGQLRHLLEQGSEPERRAAMAALPCRAGETAELLPLVTKLQASDPSAAVRAAALAWLTQARHLPALDLAARAIKSLQAVEVEQGVRSALKLGGGGMRVAVAEHILASTQPGLQTAMLRAFDGVADEDFATACRELAADRKRPQALRAAAGLVAGRALGAAAAPVLRDLLLADLDCDSLVQLLHLLMPEGSPAPTLATLFPPDRADLANMPQHLRALLLVRHPEAMRFVMTRLAAANTRPQVQAELLRATRQALLPPTPPELLEQLPEPVRGLLQ